MPPELIDSQTIHSAARQRTEIGDIADLQASIAQVGLINPIIVRRDGDTLLLVAGGRRLQACKNLGKMLEPGRDIRFWEDLDPLTASVIELEENVKRADLDWKDQARANTALHNAYRKRAEAAGQSWSAAQTASALSITERALDRYIRVVRGLDTGRLDAATGMEHAVLMLARQSDRMTEQIVGEIIAGSAEMFGGQDEGVVDRSTVGNTNSGDVSISTSLGNNNLDNTATSNPSRDDNPTSLPFHPIICADFTQWAPAYSGPKFNLIHVDFPYGVNLLPNTTRTNFQFGLTQEAVSGENEVAYENTPELYFRLLDCFTANLDRFCSYQAHVLFWFSMRWHTETKRKLEATGLVVQDHPLIWFKHHGITPGNDEYPQRTYDTCFLASRGHRKLVKRGPNGYAGPIPGNRIHPSEKSAVMLKQFFSMLVDETTTVFDPTAGSGVALRVADELGARRVFGLELNPDYADSALRAFNRARLMRGVTP